MTLTHWSGHTRAHTHTILPQGLVAMTTGSGGGVLQGDSLSLSLSLQVTHCQSLSLLWEWPVAPPTSSTDEGEEFFEGPLLKVLLDRLGRVLEQVPCVCRAVFPTQLATHTHTRR